MKHKEKIGFDLEIYPLEIIKIAVKEYSKFCTVNLEQKEKIALCTFSSDNIPADLIVLEFGNYLIELMQRGVIV